MKGFVTLLLLMVALSKTVMAQTPAETAVMKPISDLFLGMKKGDSALAHSAFARQVNFVSIGQDKTGRPVFEMDLLKEFLLHVGTPHPEVWNEFIWGTEIRIDGNLAQVWAKYAFYRGNKFSHCGVDAFQLYKADNGIWKIFNLSDTRQREGCVVPPEVGR